MRVLLSSTPTYSHLVPMLVPVARALRAAGHQVLVTTGGARSAELDRWQLPHHALPHMLAGTEFAADPELAAAIGLSPDGLPLPILNELPHGVGFGMLFAGELALRNARDLRVIAEAFRPDLVVRECTEFAGFLVAEQLGVPCVTMDNSPLTRARHPGLLPALNQTRDTIGLPPLADVTELARDPWIGWLPSQWWPEAMHTPAHQHYRPPAQAADAGLDPLIAALPADRPFVLATLGSMATQMLADESPLPKIVAALGEVDCTAVVALGSGVDPADWSGPRPANVHLASFVQQRLLLQACDLFITHAGFGGIQESLAAGVPMVAMPLYAEQPINAARIADLGLGISQPDDLAAACRTVLDEPGYRYAARGLQRAILALPSFDELITDLVKLGSS
jgi:N-glycosyltransferase